MTIESTTELLARAQWLHMREQVNPTDPTLDAETRDVLYALYEHLPILTAQWESIKETNAHLAHTIHDLCETIDTLCERIAFLTFLAQQGGRHA